MEKGLSTNEVQEQKKTFGKNEIHIYNRVSAIKIFLSQFPTVLNGILFAAAILSYIIHDTLDSIFILSILFLNASLSFIQEYRAEKSIEKLQNYITPLSRVIRDGQEREVPTNELVPGDIVVLSEGNHIPADGIILVSNHIEIDESLLTGESLPIIKEAKEELYGGTLLVKGNGRMKVEKIGLSTKFGQIASSLSQIEVTKTPLQLRLDRLGKYLSFSALFISFLLIPIGFFQQKDLAPVLLLAISIGIAAVPEGLPAVITIALALGVNRMAKKNAVVKKMPAIETLGAVQILLTDKTGTLTQNKMHVKKHFAVNKESLSLMVLASSLSNTAALVEKGDNRWDIVGDKTDGALLLWAKSLQKEKKLDGSIEDEFVFDPVNKTITTVYRQDGERLVFVRGAPEVLIEKSNLKKDKEKMIRSFEQFAKEGLRVIAFGYKKHSSSQLLKRDYLEQDLMFLGFVGIYDAPRLEARKSILEAKHAGIHTVMVTGDNRLTAISIAKEVGLIEQDEDVLTGEELKKLTDSDLEKILFKTRVFARVMPEDKLRLVDLFKKKNLVVGVTGDGVNDSLALKRADVGIAMGQSGTDVAKEASDIVLTDDNFSTIIKAIEEGRIIYNNIVKAVLYLLAGNLSELGLIFFSFLLNLPTPLLPTQILWINLVTDGLPALALASDSKNIHLLKEKPRDPTTPLITKSHMLFISSCGFGITTFLITVFYILLRNSTTTFARSVVFNLLVILHLALAFVVRGKIMKEKNTLLFVGVAFTILLQALITFTPFFQKIFHLGF